MQKGPALRRINFATMPIDTRPIRTQIRESSRATPRNCSKKKKKRKHVPRSGSAFVFPVTTCTVQLGCAARGCERNMTTRIELCRGPTFQGSESPSTPPLGPTIQSFVQSFPSCHHVAFRTGGAVSRCHPLPPPTRPGGA